MKKLTLFATLLLLGSAPNPDPDLVVHEWGTFTAVVGSDGVQMEWRPLSEDDLPGFVYSRQRPGFVEALDEEAVQLKRELVSRQRMETPVTYFYADRAMDVDVRVDFPQGLLTEWYPRVREFGPVLSSTAPPVRDGFLRWGKVKLIPPAEFEGTLPTGGEGSHYYHARDVDAAYVRVCSEGAPHEFERFLFYRGVSDFAQPMTVRAEGDGRASVANEGIEDMRSVFLLRVEGDRAGFAYRGRVRADGEWATPMPELRPKAEAMRDIEREMEACLVAEGLYTKEARAMVKTWSSSWFGDEGTRVLYVMPERLTNAILPLRVTPRPMEMKRVMVGRVEWLTPEREREIGRALLDGSAPAGRFAEPMVRRVMEATDDPRVRERAGRVLEGMRPAR